MSRHKPRHGPRMTPYKRMGDGNIKRNAKSVRWCTICNKSTLFIYDIIIGHSRCNKCNNHNCSKLKKPKKKKVGV